MPEAPALKVRFGSIAAAITIPLAGQQDLLEYARGYDALVAGRTEEIAQTFRRLGDGEIRVGDVVLPPAAKLLKKVVGAGERQKKTCFVIMGFGEKTDFQSNPQRILNLNKTFEYIIQPAVEESGLECIRADKIMDSTVIGKPMYEQLLTADLVIADLSTSNTSAIYELGVRHALRPHMTIVMAESNFAFHFDISH